MEFLFYFFFLIQNQSYIYITASKCVNKANQLEIKNEGIFASKDLVLKKKLKEFELRVEYFTF